MSDQSGDYRDGNIAQGKKNTGTYSSIYYTNPNFHDSTKGGGASSNEIQINSQTWQNKSQTRQNKSSSS